MQARFSGKENTSAWRNVPITTIKLYLPCNRLLHTAFINVGIAMAGENRFECLVGEATFAIFDDFADVKVLYRVLVGSESELAAH